MNFPTWVDGPPRKTSQQRASARLQYILSNVALQLTQRQSMRALAEKCAIDHSLLSKYIKQGYFSQSAANRIEFMLGKKHVTAAHLTNPLEIDTEKK